MKLGYALTFATVALLAGCGGGGDESAPAPAPEPELPRPSYDVDRTKTQWTSFSFTSALDGKKTTVLTASNSGDIEFKISCSEGRRSYYLTTDFITGSGKVAYRIGNNEIRNETWREASGYKLLVPSYANPNIYRQLYQNWNVVFEAHRYGGGMRTSTLRADGFPAMVDQTREVCGWSAEEFPVNNGAPTALPDEAPSFAVTPSYFENSIYQFGYEAWRQYKDDGKAVLLVRVGEDLNLCGTRSVISSKSFYVTQNGKEVTATPGFDLLLSCKTRTPFTLALQGDFDPSQPLILKTYPSPYSSTLNPGQPMSQVQL
ncbi:hypothetical protein E8K88_11835 [Lampropedia aestuarii]|uniref:Lipoprotein n=1 Tax=Lampropedia aestuarii TaxID=2562762 RepID=A0A4S5BRN8_9BURK|nr:hypothetical protein [Lampropedia aestuarii]THJ32386.1 hypothetical protein E8K88_11835 [Lampropedia aestuarii]